jgi:hypothetical protein
VEDYLDVTLKMSGSAQEMDLAIPKWITITETESLLSQSLKEAGYSLPTKWSLCFINQYLEAQKMMNKSWSEHQLGKGVILEIKKET